MTHAGLVITHLLVTVLFSPHPYEKKTPHVIHKERLIQSVSEETRGEWLAHLWSEGVEFSTRSNGADFHVAADPIGVLRNAEKVEAIRSEAQRALSERLIEQEVVKAWPRVRSVAVCIAPAEEREGGEPTAAFIVAPNFPSEERDRLNRLVCDLAPGLDPTRIRVLGAVGPATPGDNGANDRPAPAIARR